MDVVKDYSQNGEQEHILHYLSVMGIEKGHLVDLGAGDGYTMSNTRALLDMGWTGTLVDGDPKGAKDVKKVWITDRIVIDLLGFTSTIDFLNLDIDGNDYWILKAILEACEPYMIVCEINPIFQRDEWAVMPYNEAHTWNNDTYYGMSLAACEALGKEHGYTLAYLHAGINAFLVRNEMIDKHLDLLRTIEYRVKHDHRAHSPEKQWLRK